MGGNRGSPSAQISGSAAKFMPKTPTQEAGISDRTQSHTHASPSPRCGFGWVKEMLGRRLEAWNIEDARDCEDCTLENLATDPWAHKYFIVDREGLPHIIGRGGKMIKAIEDFCGVFFAVHDVNAREAQLLVSGPRSACILAQFICEMITARHFSMLETLIRHGF